VFFFFVAGGKGEKKKERKMSCLSFSKTEKKIKIISHLNQKRGRKGVRGGRSPSMKRKGEDKPNFPG